MIFERIYDDGLAQASYLLGCQEAGEAVVVDPRRDIGVYLGRARAHGLTITAVTETHIHADYLSGSRELAAATGAALYLSGEGGEGWQYGFPHTGLRHGSVLEVGRVRLSARHTPGHTPEHLSFFVTGGAETDRPDLFLSGDFVFVGDVGRPDLLDESGIGADTREPLARQLFGSLKTEFPTLPDTVQVWPGHGAGSACGKALGSLPSSTVGYERRATWWADFAARDDEDGFVRALLEGQPDTPAYFGRMKRHNRAGPALLGERAPLEPVTAADLARRDALLIDPRPRVVYARDAPEGALHVPAGKMFATYAAYVIDPERDDREIVLLADAREAERLRDELARVGIDRVGGYLSDPPGLPRRALETVTPEALSALPTPYVLDVRGRSEYEAGHIPGARQLAAGQVMHRAPDLPRDRPLVTHCESGARSAVVSSALRAAGFEVVELDGSFAAWRAAGGPVEGGSE